MKSEGSLLAVKYPLIPKVVKIILDICPGSGDIERGVSKSGRIPTEVIWMSDVKFKCFANK